MIIWVIQMKRLFCVFSALLIAFSLPACSEEVSSDKNTGVCEQTGLKYADDFFIPTVSGAFEYEADVANVDTNALQSAVEFFFGPDIWGRGVFNDDLDYSGEDIYDHDKTIAVKAANWFCEEREYFAQLSSTGAMSLYKGEYTAMYSDTETGYDEFLYFPSFERTEIILEGVSAKLSDLASRGGAAVESLLSLIGSDLEAVPVYCKRIVSDTGRLLYVDIAYALKYDGFLLRSSYINNDRFCSSASQDKYPVTHVSFHTTDEISGIDIRGALVCDKKETGVCDIMDFDTAVNKAEEKYGAMLKTVTAKYAQLEYTPTERAGDNSFKYTPQWNIYYIDSKGVNGIISVDAVSGKVMNIPYVFYDFGDSEFMGECDLPVEYP